MKNLNSLWTGNFEQQSEDLIEQIEDPQGIQILIWQRWKLHMDTSSLLVPDMLQV